MREEDERRKKMRELRLRQIRLENELKMTKRRQMSLETASPQEESSDKKSVPSPLSPVYSPCER